jgi:hypothetical protein
MSRPNPGCQHCLTHRSRRISAAQPPAEADCFFFAGFALGLRVGSGFADSAGGSASVRGCGAGGGGAVEISGVCGVSISGGCIAASLIAALGASAIRTDVIGAVSLRTCGSGCSVTICCAGAGGRVH